MSVFSLYTPQSLSRIRYFEGLSLLLHPVSRIKSALILASSSVICIRYLWDHNILTLNRHRSCIVFIRISKSITFPTFTFVNFVNVMKLQCKIKLLDVAPFYDVVTNFAFCRLTSKTFIQGDQSKIYVSSSPFCIPITVQMAWLAMCFVDWTGIKIGVAKHHYHFMFTILP